MKHFTFVFLVFSTVMFISCNKNNNSSLKSEAFLKQEERQAVLEVNPKVIDFGNIKKTSKKTLKLNVKLKNNSSNILALYKADVSCGCIEVDFCKKALHKNETTNMIINIKTENLYGIFNKSIFIRSNAKNDPEIIRVKGEVTQ